MGNFGNNSIIKTVHGNNETSSNLSDDGDVNTDGIDCNYIDVNGENNKDNNVSNESDMDSVVDYPGNRSKFTKNIQKFYNDITLKLNSTVIITSMR